MATAGNCFYENIGLVFAQLWAYFLALGVRLQAEFAYVLTDDSSILGYRVNPNTGTLTAIAGSPFAGGEGASSVTVDPRGKFVYVANLNGNNVSGYTINPATGVLTVVPGSPFTAGENPVSVVVDPSGGFAYVANYNGYTVSAYTISPATGALTPITGSPFAAGQIPESVTVDPSGRFLYVANLGNSVSAYTINPTIGLSFTEDGNPVSVTVHPSGKFLYVANIEGENVSGYKINPTTGALAAITGSPFFTGFLPAAVAVSPNGKFAYVLKTKFIQAGEPPLVGPFTGIIGYAIDPATGILTAIAGPPPFDSGLGADSMAFTPTSLREIHIINEGSKSVSVINPSTNTVAATVTRRSQPR
jgi:6-phosphogluconolactonase